MYKTRLSKFFVIVLFSLFSLTKGYASHFGAADLWVTYIGTTAHPLRYVVHLGVYRACEAGQSLLSSPESVSMTSNGNCSTTQAFPTTISLQMDTIVGHGSDTLDQLCNNFKALNSCRQPTSVWPGFNRFNYTDTVDLPYRCSDWTFVWTNCCRNAGIQNLCQPASSYSLTIDCHINDLFGNENSPRFTIDPIPYLCINQLDQFFNGPYDPNGDSLFVENEQPWGCGGTPCAPGCGPNTEIPYNTSTPIGGIPYTLLNPIQSQATPYIVDPITGIATFTPSKQGKFVLAFKVSKYDPVTKTLLGSTRRDVQVSVLPCNAPPPIIDSIPQNISGGLFSAANPALGTGNVIYTCPNSPVTFTMTATSSSNSNKIYLNVDSESISNTPGDTFTVPGNGAAVVHGTYTWTPGDTSLGAHTIVFIATDSTCSNSQPIVLISYLVVTIDVISGINAIPKVYRNCPLANTPVTLNVAGLPKDFTYKWTDYNDSTYSDITNPSTANPSVHPSDTTKYIVTVPNFPSSCKTSDTVTVNVDNSNHMSISPATPVIFCKEGRIYLTANPVGHKPSTNLSCGVPITRTDSTTRDSTTIIPVFGAYAGSISSNISPSPFTGNASAHHQYLIRASDMLNSGMISGALTGISFSVRQLPATVTYDTITVSLQCTPLTAVNTDGSLITGSGTQVFSTFTPITISSTGFLTLPFNTTYNWDTTQNLLVDICYSNGAITAAPPAFDYVTSGYPSSTFVYNDAGDVCAGDSAFSGGYPLYELPVISFNYYDAPTVPFPYAWQTVYGSNILSDSTLKTPEAYIYQSTRFYVTSRGKSGCSFRDSVDIYLDPVRHPYVTPMDTNICVNSPVQLIASDTKNGWKWYQNDTMRATTLNCDTCQAVIAIPDTTIRYTAVFTDSVNCVDTAFSRVFAVPYPKSHLAYKDTTIKYGKSTQLVVLPDTLNAPYTYVWSPSFTLDNPYLHNPTATPAVPTVYSVIVYNQFCPAYDTVNVNIDYRSNIFVPSAFTPNNDGKNDVFRITNLTYERVIEFRVFNRWGQQIFSATDNHGWDGTWNGTLMDIGAYNYIIRVVYPDGVEDNFKGSVTLIR